MRRGSAAIATAIGIAAVYACPFDASLREFLSRRFWLPFSKHGAHFAKANVRRTSAPFAGIAPKATGGALVELRNRYSAFSMPMRGAIPGFGIADAIAAARADKSLTPQQREEVDLIDAKVDMRLAFGDGYQNQLASSKKKLEAFLRTARDAAYRSEARGWLARVLYLQGNQTAAGKIYLDELNRNGSNLSQESLLNSLRIVYGYDGGPMLREHLAEYFDTPEHAAFAIQLITNPRWRLRPAVRNVESPPRVYGRIRDLLAKHPDLLRQARAENSLPMLAMRTALRMGDVEGAARIANEVPADAPLRSNPDFLWALGSARFLSRDYAGAEEPLVKLFGSKSAEEGKRAAAAYGLCGVYQKLGRPGEQLRYGIWLSEPGRRKYLALGLADLSVYYAPSGWDLNLLLEFEAPIDALREFVDANPKLPGVEMPKYSLAVRLGRENRYVEAAEWYAKSGAPARAARMRRMAELHAAVEASPADLEARYRLAEFISANAERLYFNDRIWGGYQRYVFRGEADTRLNRAERQRLIAAERKLLDEQEERWRAYLILKDVVRDAGKSPVGRKSARLAVNCLRQLSDRFGRAEEIRGAEMELSRRLAQ